LIITPAAYPARWVAFCWASSSKASRVRGACPVRDPTTWVRGFPLWAVSGGGEYLGCGVYAEFFQGVCLLLGAGNELIEGAGSQSGVGVGEAA